MSGHEKDPRDGPFMAARLAMVANQIAARGIHDPRVLDAMRRVPRHLFVDPGDEARAYDDTPLPIGLGQTISQPYMVALMTQTLQCGPGDHVLEIGTGSGYQAAILAELCRVVISIERHPPLAERAAQRLRDAGYANIAVLTSDGTLGYPAAAPYDRILVTAGAPRVPRELCLQLAAAGRLVCPVGTRDTQQLVTVTRTAQGFVEEAGIRCIFVPLVGKDGWKEQAPPPAPEPGPEQDGHGQTH